MVRLLDIAEAAHVSAGTVSKVLNKGSDFERISTSCAAKIEKLASEMGYNANYHARSLKKGQSNAVGMVIGGISLTGVRSSFISALISGVEAEVQKRYNHFIIIGSSEGNTPLENGLRFLQEHRIDGLVVLGYFCSKEDIRLLESCGFPVALIYYPYETSLPAVSIDDRGGIRKAVEHLVTLGHRHIAWMGPHPDMSIAARRRLEGFREGIAAHAVSGRELFIDKETCLEGNVEGQIEYVKRAAVSFREEYPAYSSFICFHEVMALGVYAAASDRGERIPDDISVVGFDDVVADVVYPAMTSVSHMFEKSAEYALDCLASPEKPHCSGDIECVLIERSSTARKKEV